MKTSLLFFLLLSLTITGFSQGPTIDAGPADTVTCPPDCIDLSATYTGGGNTTDYEISDITYAPDAYAGTLVTLWDDAISGALQLGLILLLRNTYSNFYICSNGDRFYGGPTTYTPAAIPSAAFSTPKNCIMGTMARFKSECCRNNSLPNIRNSAL